MDDDLPALELIKAGDERGLRQLMDRHKNAVFHFALRYCGNQADAEDITAETFYRVHQKAHRFRTRGRVRTWIFTIAANLSRDLLRRKKKRRTDVSLEAEINSAKAGIRFLDTVADSELAPVPHAEIRESMRAVQVAINRLPHKLRFPLVFCVLEDHSQEACAQVLGVSVKTIETRIYRARKKLREILENV